MVVLYLAWAAWVLVYVPKYLVLIRSTIKFSSSTPRDGVRRIGARGVWGGAGGVPRCVLTPWDRSTVTTYPALEVTRAAANLKIQQRGYLLGVPINAYIIHGLRRSVWGSKHIISDIIVDSKLVKTAPRISASHGCVAIGIHT